MKDFKEVVEKMDFVGVGVFSYLGNVVVWFVINFFKGVVKVGEVLWGKDDK